MDHSHMDHSHMGHGDHDGSMDDMCNMNMLFTWDTTNLCIVFRQWHVRGNLSLFFSLAAVVLLGMGFEALRSACRRYEQSTDAKVAALPSELDTETTPFIPAGQNQPSASQSAHLVKAVLYALQNFYAFMLMLIFMTYNGWVMVAVSLGAFFGYLAFGQQTSATKENACH